MSTNNLQEDDKVIEDSELLDSVPASVVFVEALQHQVNEHDVNAIISSQKHMLARFEKTNEMLVNCNALLTARHVGASKELKKHITFLVDLKKDLEGVFRRIRFLKMKLSQQYSDAFASSEAANRVFDDFEEEEEKEISVADAPPEPIVTAASSSGSQGSSPSSPSTSDTG
ncbi:hypothetical protein JTE90_006482 [Oedothorax gibbosus]|uniref:KxDL domain-containing protein n=1 Tax=Oedothorax gibbosus TaxID=931172 RepID=A0AAV6VNR8_9ARAC|nr:hypothetical protein JTE90_006482 [Oedothorax gibbosus]